MNRFSQFFKKVADKVFTKKARPTPPVKSEPKVQPPMKMRKRGWEKKTSTRGGRAKHRLHDFHFGQFSPRRGFTVGGRRQK